MMKISESKLSTEMKTVKTHMPYGLNFEWSPVHKLFDLFLYVK